jgi:hypothetical protein
MTPAWYALTIAKVDIYLEWNNCQKGLYYRNDARGIELGLWRLTIQVSTRKRGRYSGTRIDEAGQSIVDAEGHRQ